MAATLTCCMHVCARTNTNISSFSDSSFAKFKDCVLRWSVLPGIYGALARDVTSKYCIESSKSLADFQDHEHGESCIGYHRECYQRFTDVNKLNKTEERLAKNPPRDDDSTDDDNGDLEPVCKKRTLRSNVAGPSSSGRPHILPVSCIICHADHWIRDKVTCKRRREPLTRCETIDAGKLRKAAELTCNESLLLQMRGRDLVASEARYHPSCFRNATRFLTRKLPKETTDILYAESYAKFCHNFIDEQILKQQGAIRMTKLTAQFIKTVKEVQGIDASSYRSYNLKRRLQGSYPQLQFLRPTRRYESEVVITRTVEAQDLAVNLVNLQDDTKSSSELDTSSGSESDLQYEQKGSCSSQGISLSDMYFTARQLRIAVQEVHVDTAWPQTGQDLTLAIARNLVPVQLYNFLAWLIGASEEPSESERVAVPELHDRRILSMAQDIIYNSSGGKKSMPKHAALAMTVRHLTGSAKLIGLLNGFGHATSHSVVLEHDTALAQKQLDMGPINLPPFIKQREFTTLIWDNNDFGEETLSGSGTTHNTNGIVVQTQQADHSPEDTFCCPPVAYKKTKSRSLEPPPTELASYYGGAKKEPSVFGAAIPIHETTDGQVNAMTLDTSYVLSRAIQRESNQHKPPSWTGFNTLIADSIPAKSIIGYLPVIDASPTEMDTIETILCRSLEIADALHLPTIVKVFDQAIYAKAQQIRWKSGPYSSRIIVRLGAFHTAMTFLACLGKRFGDAGLEEVAIASEVVAQGSINGVLNGHHYNRSVRFHKLMFEALHRLRFQRYIATLPTDEALEVDNILASLSDSFPTNFPDSLSNEKYQSLLQSYQEFVSKAGTNPMFAFWSSYIDMVQVLLFIRASRESNWDLHLSSIRSMMPWFMAYDRVNYARYAPVYWLEMKELRTKHPTVEEEFQRGHFSVQRHTSHGFAGIPCDQTIEQTANRDSKTKGGLTGITVNKGAVHRWISSHHMRAEISRECEKMAGKGEVSRQRKDLDPTRNERDERDIIAIMSSIESMVDPFDQESNQLVNLTSGVVASKEVADDLASAKSKGEVAVQSFITDRLQGEETGFFAPIKRLNLKTFASMRRKRTTKVKGKVIELKSNRNLFARLLLCGTSRNVSLESMLHYCLGPLPLSLSTHDGTLVKHPKAKLMHHLESCTEDPYLSSIPQDCTWIVDAMAMLQQLKVSKLPATFGELADVILSQLVKLADATSHKQIHFVTDQYPAISIKNAERERRAGTSGVQTLKIYGRQMKVPRQWKKFLSHGPNKEDLVKFLFNEIKTILSLKCF